MFIILWRLLNWIRFCTNVMGQRNLIIIRTILTYRITVWCIGECRLTQFYWSNSRWGHIAWTWIASHSYLSVLVCNNVLSILLGCNSISSDINLFLIDTGSSGGLISGIFSSISISSHSSTSFSIGNVFVIFSFMHNGDFPIIGKLVDHCSGLW